MSEEVKFLIIGDLHGQKPLIHFKNFDAIIAPGDFGSDKIRKYWKGWEKAKDKHGKKYTGSYEYAIAKYGKKPIDKIIKESLLVGRKIIKHLASFNKPVFIIPGNWDDSGNRKVWTTNPKRLYRELISRHIYFSAENTNKILTKGIKNIIDCQLRLVKFKGYNILGYGIAMVPELPDTKKILTLQKFKDKITGEELKKVIKSYNKLFSRLERKYLSAKNRLPLIFLSHNMPYNTKFDRIHAPKTIFHKKHYGSVISRDFILKHKPLVCIGGHMHEYFGKIKLGKTTVINAGFGSKVNTLLTIKNGKINSIKFYPKPYEAKF